MKLVAYTVFGTVWAFAMGFVAVTILAGASRVMVSMVRFAGGDR